MWHLDFNFIDWRNGIMGYDGDPFETYMCVNQTGNLLFGIKALTYFAEYGVPYEELVMLYDILMKHDQLPRKLWGQLEDPLYIVQDVLIANKTADKKKKK